MTTSTISPEKHVSFGEQNAFLAKDVLKAVIEKGVKEFCFCPGSRNSPFFSLLMQDDSLKTYLWPEERSAAFFALGRSRETCLPVAVITTSGTAAGELLPATMDGYYTNTPLILITADRPRRFRGKGAPQSAEQVGIYGVYAPTSKDLAFGESCEISSWNSEGPCHLNVCFEEPQTLINPTAAFVTANLSHLNESCDSLTFEQFCERVIYPLVIVAAVPKSARESLVKFLLELNAPVYLEAISGIREDIRLRHLRITKTEDLWNQAKKAEYPIDGILRIGGMPTIRLWRDLEDKRGEVAVCSINETSFSGISWAGIIQTNLDDFLRKKSGIKRYNSQNMLVWLSQDRIYQHHLHGLFHAEPCAESSLIHHLSCKIPLKSTIYLGNSLPIREWDLAATDKDRAFDVRASRGINGIDGQISAFLGMSREGVENWAIIGDLTALYDLSAPWILSQMENIDVNIVIINNGGGMIFSRLYSDDRFLNQHQLSFEAFAKLWGMQYERWTTIPHNLSAQRKPNRRIIEIVPDNASSERFFGSLPRA